RAAPSGRAAPPSLAAPPSRAAQLLLLLHCCSCCYCCYCCSAATIATAAPLPTASTATMASPTVLTFDSEGRAVDFDVWVDDLQLFLLCDSRDGVSLFDNTSGVSTAPTATADSTVRSQWTTRDAVARLAVCSHLPPAERAHFGQYKTAQSLYDAVVARYSSPATSALSRLMLPYPFPDLAAFATVADLITHLRISDTRYRAALPIEDHFLSLCPTELTVDLLEERLTAAEKGILAVAASRGDPRAPFFEGANSAYIFPKALPPGNTPLLVSPPVAPYSSLAPLPGSPLPATPSWHALPPPCLWSSQVSASPPALACPTLPSLRRGAAARRSSLLLVSPVDFSPADSPHGLRLQLREQFDLDQPVLRLHSERGGEFSSDLLRDFFPWEGILQPFTLPDSPQQNGIAERRIGIVMEASPTLRWTGEVGDASVFRVWGSRAFVRDTSADKLFARAIPCVFLGFPPDARGWQFYHPTSHRIFPSPDVTFDESVPFYCLVPYHSAPPPPPPPPPPLPPPLFLAPGPPPVDPLPPQGPCPSGVSQVDPLPSTVPVDVAGDSGAARGAASGGAESGGAESEGAGSGGAELGGAEPRGVEPGGAETAGVEPGGVEPGGTESEGAYGAVGAGDLAARDTGAGVTDGAGGTGGAAAAGSGGARTRGTGRVGVARAGDPMEPGAAESRGTRARGPGTGGAGAGGAGASGAGAGGTGAGGAGARGAGVVHPGTGGAGAGGIGAGGTVRPRPYFVLLLQQVLGVPSSSGLTPPLLCPPPDQSQLHLQPASPLPAPFPYSEQTSGLTERREPASRPASPVRTSRRVPRPRPPPIPGTHAMALRPSSVPLRVPLLPPPESSLHAVPDPDRGPALEARCRPLPPVVGPLPPVAGPLPPVAGPLSPVAGPQPPRREPLSPQQLLEWYSRRCRGTAGATGGAAGAGAAGGAAGAGAAGGAAGAGAAGGAGGAAGAGAAAGAAGAAGAVAAGGAAGAGAAGGATGAGATGGIAGASGGAAGAGSFGGAAGAGAAGAGAAGGAAGAGAAGGAGGAAGGGAAGGTSGTGDPGAGGTGSVSGVSGGAVRPRLYYVPLLQQPASPLPRPSPYSGPTRGLTECREPESQPVSPESRSALPVRPVHAGRVSRPRPPPVPGTHSMTLRPSTAPQRVPLPSPPVSSLPAGQDPASNSLRAASPAVARFLATAVTDPLFESTAASALVTELVDFAAACRLDYATSLVAASASASIYPPSVGGECALSTDVLEDRQEEFECFSASVPHLVSMLIAPEGDPDALDIPTPHSYAEAIEGPYSSQWQAAMDAEMASWKSTGTYINEVPPPGANIVSGMWIFRVKRPPGSPPAFKARYVARGFTAQRDYELHSLDFSTTFLQGSLHEEIWLRRPLGFSGSFPAGTQWSLRRQVYGLRQAPRQWHDTLRTTLAALGFTPSTADPSLFLRTDTSLPPFCVLVYVNDLVFATADIEALTLVKSELQKRHTCTDLGELRNYLGLQITRDRARRTITLTQSHMVHQVLQRFGFQFSSPQPTPLSTGHSLSVLVSLTACSCS
ncbi:unnamed protein product, partial [Closterium sp. NIES-54]